MQKITKLQPINQTYQGLVTPLPTYSKGAHPPHEAVTYTRAAIHTHDRTQYTSYTHSMYVLCWNRSSNAEAMIKGVWEREREKQQQGTSKHCRCVKVCLVVSCRLGNRATLFISIVFLLMLFFFFLVKQTLDCVFLYYWKKKKKTMYDYASGRIRYGLVKRINSNTSFTKLNE